jgi:hypothetical protein
MATLVSGLVFNCITLKPLTTLTGKTLDAESLLRGYKLDNAVLAYQGNGFIPCALFHFWITQMSIPLTARRRPQNGFKMSGYF